MFGTITKRSFALAATLSLVAALGAGCSSSKKNENAVVGAAKVSVSGSALQQSDAASMTLTIGPGTGTPSFSNIVQAMSKNSVGDWTGYVSSIPAGAGRTFHVDAYDSASAKIYQGDATATITTGSTATVYMMLQQLAPANQFANHAPVIDSLAASAALVTPGTAVSLTISAHDPDTATDPNNKIAGYKWTATCGTLAGDTTTTPTWTAPPAPSPDQTCTINVTVTDVCPASQPAVCASSVTASLQIQVQTSQAGDASVVAYPNTCPAITSVNANETFSYDAQGKVNGYEADLTINAADVDGDDLHYVWSAAGCPGAIFTPTGANPTGEIANAPTTVHFKANTTVACDVRVDVKDFWKNNLPPTGSGLAPARGCNNVGFLSLAASKDFNLAPVIVRLNQPNPGNQVAAGQAYTFGADVSDPQNAYPLTIVWTNTGNSGTIGAKVPAAGTLSGAGTISAQWTAPATIVAGMKIKFVVTNALSLSTEHEFLIVPANACGLAGSDGQACDTGLGACAPNGHCASGACVSATPVTCNAPPACHTATGATCNPADGACTYPAGTQNASCNDHNGCTQNDACNASGACLPGSAPTCTPPNSVCYAAGGTCTSTGDTSFTCNFTPLAVNTACTPTGSYDHCFQNYACDGAGACSVTSNPVSCTSTTCSSGGTCDPTTGHCTGGSPAPVTTPCSDGLGCTTGDHCDGIGSCVGGAPLCAAPSTCVEPGTCQGPAAPSAQALVQQGGALGLALGLAYDEQGFVYEAGLMFQPGFDFGCGLMNSAGSSDAFVVKLDPATGMCVPASTWSKDYGDALNDQTAQGVGVNLAQVGLIGQFAGKMDIGNGHSLNNTGAPIDYVAGLDRSNGNGVWINGYDLNDPSGAPGGKLNSIAGGLVSTNPSSGHFALCGYVSNKVPTLVNDAAAVAGGGLDIVVAVLDNTGALVWGKQFGGTGDQTCNAVTFDDAGNVLITGAHKGTLSFPGLPALTNPTGSNSWAYVAKLDGLTGTPLSAATFGATGTSRATPRAIAVDSGGNVAITGQFQAGLTFGSTTLTATGTSLDVFTAKLSSSLSPLWANRLGGTAADDARAVAFDSIGQVYVTGVFDSSVTGVASFTTFGGTDAFILRLDPSTGNASYADHYGDALGQEGFTLVATRLATGAQKDAVWSLGNFASTITFPGQPQLVGSTTETRKYLVKLK